MSPRFLWDHGPITAAAKSIFALNPEEHLVAKHLKSAGADLRSVWGGTLYMPEDQVFQSQESLSFAKLPKWMTSMC